LLFSLIRADNDDPRRAFRGRRQRLNALLDTRDLPYFCYCIKTPLLFRYRTTDNLGSPQRPMYCVGSGSGPYAKALTDEMVKTGVEAMYMFRRVALRVNREIGQDPWMSASTLPEVYFAGNAAPGSPPPPLTQPSEVERAWGLAKSQPALPFSRRSLSGTSRAFMPTWHEHASRS
jgi:hypothetical protein